MKKFFQYLLLSLLFSYAAIAQSFLQAKTISPTSYKVVRVWKSGGSSFQYNQATNFSIGHQNFSSPSEEDVFRSMYQFDLPSTLIPSNAIITSATLQSYVTGYISIDDGQQYYNLIVKLLSPTVNPNNFSLQQRFDSAAVGTQRAKHRYTDTVYTNVINDITARRVYGKVIYGGSCSQEEYTTSKALLNLQLTIKYYIPFNVTAQNNFTGGKMGIVAPGISNSNATVPYTKTGTKLADAFTLTAKAQTDNTSYSRVWNTSSTNQSKWTRLRANGTQDDKGYNISLGFNIDSADAAATYTANLRKMCNVSLIEQTEGGTINAGVKGTVVEQNPYSLTAPSPLTVGGFTSQFLNWSDGVTTNPRVVTPTSHTSLTALYKAVHKSNNVSAFSNNSQRKLVRTLDGWLHQVYESAGRVWLEHSTDNGTTWFLGNNSQPLDNGEGKCPSIDWFAYGGYNALVVAFQQKNGNYYTIQISPFSCQNGTYINKSTVYGKSNLFYTETVDPYTTNANPNITRGYGYSGNSFVLTFERKSGSTAGINWFCGYIYDYGFYWNDNFAGPVWISGTNSNSINASVHLNKTNSYPGNFDVVFEQYVSGASGSIKDVFLDFYKNGQDQWVTTQQGSPFVISSSTGVSNYKPSMVQMPDCNIRVCWIRSLNGQPQNSPFSVNVVYWNSAAPSQYSIYGWSTRSVSLNVRDDNAKTFYAFSQYSMNNQWENYISNGSNYVQLSTTGNDVQLSNGPLSGSNSNMYTSVYYNSTLPYYFQNAGAIGSQLSKSSLNQISCGRGAVLGKDDFQFSYSLKNLSVDNNNIKFVVIPETPAYKIPDSLRTEKVKAKIAMRKWEKENHRYSKLDTLNTVLLSEPFAITGKSNMILSEESGFLDTIAAVNALGDNGYVAYKLELVDNGTKKPIAVIKESKFTSTNLSSCKLASYNLNVSKVGTRTVRVRITINTNIEGLQGALVDEYGTIDVGALSKSTVNEINLQGSEVIKEYALEQNYPNPFNPSTTIHYQIPNAGQVTLKVYDMLGRDVATLVDGMKETGYYSVTFDGTKLSSGIYFIRMNVQPQEGAAIVQVRKMVLTK